MPATSRTLDPTGTAHALNLGASPGGWFTPGRSGGRDDGELPVEELHLAWEAATWAPGMDEGGRRALALLLGAVGWAVDRGGTRLPLDSGGAATLDGFGLALGARPEERRLAAVLLDAMASGRVPSGLCDIVGAAESGVPRRPYVVADGGLYQHRHLVLEREVAAALAARLEAGALPAGGMDPERIVSALPGRERLAPEQLEAIRRALVHPFTVITGGPGTGKTTIVAGIVAALAAAGIPAEAIALAAPTGKAAQRMTEALASRSSSAPAAGTLHRLLGYDARTGRPRHDRHHPLPHVAVIVDEGSMIDLALMQALLGALPPTARLIMLGDADQLPAVAPGDVFSALAPSGVRLVHSYRLDARDEDGAHLLRAAHAVAAGTPAALDAHVVPEAAALRFRGLELLMLPDDPRRAASVRHDFLVRWYRQLVEEEDRSRRLLCVTRGAALPTGAAAVNQELARLHAAAHGLPWMDGFAPGTPVIVERNDHGRGLWNGDTGTIALGAGGTLPPAPGGGRPPARGLEPGLSVLFPRPGGGTSVFPLAAIRELLSPAWAVTVHKAQGSEHDGVALLLPEHDLPLLGRQSLYTAMTRARRSVVLVGRRDLVERAIARPMTRTSGLAAALQRIRENAPGDTAARL